MVRKRSRTSRKYYDDDNDSDSDFALEEPPSQPAQKKYSLRQRKRRLFTEFEFDDDGDEIEPTKVPSDDDDFEVERELEPTEANNTEFIKKEPYTNHYEPEPEDTDALIDFEDMIRADIVVNKNRIDYDNIIQKTLIKVQPIENTVQAVIRPKRGRKPKTRAEGEIDSSLLEPKTEMQEIELEDRNNSEQDLDEELIDCAKLMHAELSESAVELTSNNPTTEFKMEQSAEENVLPKTDVKSENEFETSNFPEEEINKITEINNRETENVNGGTSPIHTSSLVAVDDQSSQISKPQVVDTEDDDVVLVEDEKKCEVIVLDD